MKSAVPRLILLVIACVFPFFAHSQIVEISKWGPSDRPFKLELIVSSDSIDSYNVGGLRYLSITKQDFRTVVSVLDSLNVPELMLADVSKVQQPGAYSIVVVSELGLKEYYLSDSKSANSFFIALTKQMNGIEPKAVFKAISINSR
tara:strand:+ start:897 stop:1334 length:438 start_codon:yes stop_codon:yes gene_type:complete